MTMENKNSILEQAIADAKLLRESAIKHAEAEVLKRYSKDLNESVIRFLEQDEDESDPFLPGPEEAGIDALGTSDTSADDKPLDPVASKIPLAATDGEKMCPCPEEEEEVEIDFGNIDTDMSADQASQEEEIPLPGLEDEEESLKEAGEEDYRVELPESFSGRLVPFAEVLGQDSATGQMLEMVLDGSPIPKDLIEMCLRELQDLAFQGYDDSSLNEIANELRDYFEPTKEQSVEVVGLEEQEEDILSQIAALDNDLNEISTEDEDEVDLGMLEALIADLENTPSGKIGSSLTSKEVDDKNDIASVLASADDVLGGNPVVDPVRRNVPSTPATPEKAGGDVSSAEKYDDDNAKLRKRLREMEDLRLAQEQQISSLRTELTRLQNENNGLSGVVVESKKKLQSLSLKNVKLAYLYETLASGASLNERQKQKLVESIQQSGSVEEIRSVFEKEMSSSSKVEEFRNLLRENRFTLATNSMKNTGKQIKPDGVRRLQELAGIKSE